MPQLKISVITPSFNQGKFIEQNIQSVLTQRYPLVEHIVVDGGSSDETLEILKKYPHVKWVSEKDEGQADALNKGLSMATGDIIGWINSDDYYEPDIFSFVVNTFEDENVNWIIGDVSFEYMVINKKIQRQSPKITVRHLLKNPDILRQQGAFFRKSFLKQEGGWNKKFQLVMDLDLWLRLAKASEPVMVSKKIGVFRMQPDQKTSGRNLLKQLKEIKELFDREQAGPFHKYPFLAKKYFYYLKYLAKQELIKRNLVSKIYSNIPISSRNLNEDFKSY